MCLPPPQAEVPAHIWRIHGRDYDLTSFVEQHPGGALMILLGKGTDCTNLFESYHVMNEPRKRLRTHDVTPDGLNPPVPECPSEFFSDCRAMIRQHFAGRPPFSHKTTPCNYFRLALLLAAEAATAYWWISQRSILGAFCVGYVGWLLMANLAHDSSHGALSRHPVVNYVGGFLGSFPFGWHQCCWWLQHVVSHHGYTNEVGHDVDAHHQCFARWHRAVSLEIVGGRILGGMQQLFWHAITMLGSTVGMTIIHPIQFLWVPLAAATSRAGLSPKHAGGIEDAETPRHGLFCPPMHDGAFDKIGGNFARQRVLLHSKPMFLANVAVWAGSLIILWAPFFYTLSCGESVGKGLLMGMVPFMTSSLMFMITTQISHIQDECQAMDVCNEPDYFKRQARTSMDYSTSSTIIGFLTGYLNLQSIHHTLPSIASVHYTELYPKFLLVCERHGCAPQRCPSIVHALWKHLAYIFRLGSSAGDVEVPGYDRPARVLL